MIPASRPPTASSPLAAKLLAAMAALSLAAASSAYADTALTTGQTTIDTTGNPALGIISRSTGATAQFNTAGTATATGTSLVNGILGPWAFIGTGTSTRYTTLDGSNNVVSFTGTATTWAGTVSDATANYEISASGVSTYGGSQRVANTIRYTGGSGTTITLGNSANGAGLTANGILNAGTAGILFNTTGSGTAGFVIGSNAELVLNAANAGITISARIHNTGTTSGVLGTTASAVTIVGPNTVAFSGANTYTGATTVNSGTLALGSATTLQSATGNVIVNGGTLSSTVASTTLGGNLTVSGGSLAANGASAGTFALAANKNFSMTTGTFTYSLNDTITGSGTGTFAITGGTFDLTNSISNYGIAYSIFSGFSSGAVSGLTFANYDTTNYVASLSNAGQLSFSAIPEPSTYAALAGVLALGAVIIRRRRSATKSV